MISPEFVSAVVPTRGDVDLEESLAPIRQAGIAEVIVYDNRGEVTIIDYAAATFTVDRGTVDGAFPTDLVTPHPDLAVYGRYAGIAWAKNPVIFVQDDDVVLDDGSIGEILAAYETGMIVANMPERFRHDFYADHCLVGFGAVFDRELPRHAFRPFPREYVASPSFLRTCDVVFSTLTPRKLVDVGYRDREYASDANRMWRQPTHLEERTRALADAIRVRDAVRL